MLRRALIVLLSALMLVTAVTPALAAEQGAAPREAIQLAKSFFPETDEFTSFYSTVENYDGRLIYSLYWQGKDGTKEDSYDYLTVRVDGINNLIIGYSRDRAEQGGQYAPIPVLTEAEVKAKAEEFLRKLVPEQFGTMSLDQVQKPSIVVGKRSWSHGYGFTYIQYVNGIAFRSNNINVRVNADTGEVVSYNMNWQVFDFLAPEGIIGMEEAGRIFTGRGLKLMYLRSYWFRSNGKPYLAYVLEDGYQLQIDAFTGEISVGGIISPDRPVQEAAPPGAGGDMADKGFTEYELREIDLLEGLLTASQAEAKVRELLNLPEDFEMTGSSLWRDYEDESLRFWNINWFVVRGEDVASASARVNAADGSVLSFNFSEKEDKSEHTLTPEAAESIARAFLQKAAPAEYGLTKLATEHTVDPENGYPYSYGFSFERYHNGIPVQGDNLYVEVRHDGRIVGFYVSWYRAELPSSTGVMPSDAMAAHFLAAYGLDLEYVLRYEGELYSSVKPVEYKVALVYRPAALNTYNFDPRTGANLDWQGNPLVAEAKPQYIDIAGHWAQNDINLLVELGLLRLPGDSFRPDEAVILGDLLKMLADASGWGDGVIILPRAYGEYQDTKFASPLGFGLSRGLFPEDSDLDPNTRVTREIFAFYLAKMLGHGPTAALKGIWAAPFGDFASVAAEYQGSVAVMYAEGVMRGDGVNFLPKAVTTRAQVVATLANMLRMK
ncbi:MAG TPA: YcdB/YcdC domain-containing protein [Bacillota bacterium]|nr:YcdB/YcdC domain-containing protein [Bacillota bacterium]